MILGRTAIGLAMTALAVVGASLSPAFGAGADTVRKAFAPSISLGARGGIGSFTPASADPRVAAVFGRAGLSGSGFRFTPAGTPRGNRAVTVAVRSQTTANNAERIASVAPVVAITPVAYSLGVSVGWRRFALSGDMARVDLGIAPGSREKLDVGVSYNAPKWSTRLQVGRDQPIGVQPRLATEDESVSLDLASSYSITRNVDLTAGVRYKSQRDRLQISDDGRRDSQAVYIGTAFKF